MRNLQFKLAALASACGALFSGCAVMPGEVDKSVHQAEQDIAAVPKPDAVVKAAEEPDLLRVQGNYLGSGAIPLDAGNGLPSRFSDVFLSEPKAEGTLIEAMRYVRDATGLPVRIDPDVYAAGCGSMAKGQGDTPAAAAGSGSVVIQPVSNGGPLPSNFAALRASQGGQAGGVSEAGGQAPSQTMVPLNFHGSLADYENLITSTADVNWEPDENGGLYVYRWATRAFSVDLLPQAVDVSDITTGGGQTSLGSQSTGGGSGSGSSTTSNSSTSNLSSKFEPWNDYIAAVKGMLSSCGRAVANRATGTVVVTDRKASVDRIGSYIAAENVKLRTRVDIEVRTVTLQVNEGTELGADFNVVYAALNAAGSSKFGLLLSPPSTASGGSGATLGSITYTNTAGGRANGSQASLSALDQYGKVVNDKTEIIHARNRAPAVVLSVTDETYLAQTTPATGGGTSGGTGVPGLTPGAISYGSFFTIMPNVSDNGTVTLSFSNTESTKQAMNTYQSGQGETFQQISAPVIGRGKNATDLVIPKDATEISVSNSSDSWTSQSNVGIGGGSANRNHSRTVTITLVTPHVLPGV